MDTRPGAAGRVLLGFGVTLPSRLPRAQQRFLAVTVGVLLAIGTGATLLVGVLTRSYMWGFAAMIGSSFATAAILASLAVRWRDENAAAAAAESPVLRVPD